MYFYYALRDYPQALEQTERITRLWPNLYFGHFLTGLIHRRQGKWDLTLDELKKSIELDPRDPYTIGGLAETDIFLRRWKEAEDFARRGLTIDPHELQDAMWVSREDVRKSLAGDPSAPFLAPPPAVAFI